jgi:hypothetical protein
MKKYIKHLKEYEDSELLDLMGDLGDIGFETYQGWIFSWDSSTEKPLVEIMIAPSPRQAFELYKANGWFGPDIDYASKKRSFEDLDQVFKYLADNKIINSYNLVWGLNAVKEIKEPEFINMHSINPYSLVNLINSKFTNGEEKYNSLLPSRPIQLVP